MANSIGGGGNYFSQINQNLAKGPDLKTAENLRQNSGTAASQRRTATKPSKGAASEDGGIQLSDAAQKSLQASHKEHIEGHEHELAHQAGLQEYEPDNAEDHEIRSKRGHDRDQETKAEQNRAGGQAALPPGSTVVVGKNGVQQVLTFEEVRQLKALDGDLEEQEEAENIEERVLGDIPDANLEAACKVLDTQMKSGLGKVAGLKQVPEAAQAGEMQLEGADFMGGPLDIREPGNDRLMPVQLDFPDSMEEIARERAAQELARGQSGQEEIVAS